MDTTNTPTPETVKRYWVDPTSRFEPDGSKNDMVPASDYDRIEAAALSAANRLHEAQVELLRLAAEAKAPKVWDADSIKDAPEGFYYYHWKEGSPNGEGWAELWQSNNPDVETLDFVRENLLDGRHVDAAFGPIPQPPPMKEGE